MFQKLYEIIVTRQRNPRTVGHWWTRILVLSRRILLRFFDPSIEMDVRGRKLRMPFSHQLPMCDASYPGYNKMLTRLAHFMKERFGYLKMVDVGANIGDTASICSTVGAATFLCVEADPKYADLLQRNLKGLEYTLVRTLCGSKDSELNVNRIAQEGTVEFKVGPTATPAEKETCRTLDSILRDHSEFALANLLKIDCDGYDFDVLRGASELLAKRPAVFFESAPFNRSTYLSDVRESFRKFKNAGYSSVLLYDNFGSLFGRFALEAESAWTDALVYQLVSDRIFFDILALPDPLFDEFANLETHHYATLAVGQSAAK